MLNYADWAVFFFKKIMNIFHNGVQVFSTAKYTHSSLLWISMCVFVRNRDYVKLTEVISAWLLLTTRVSV